MPSLSKFSSKENKIIIHQDCYNYLKLLAKTYPKIFLYKSLDSENNTVFLWDKPTVGYIKLNSMFFNTDTNGVSIFSGNLIKILESKKFYISEGWKIVEYNDSVALDVVELNLYEYIE